MKTDEQILDWLDRQVQQPVTWRTMAIHNSQDMGYQENFISFSMTDKRGREVSGKGNNLREAITAAIGKELP